MKDVFLSIEGWFLFFLILLYVLAATFFDYVLHWAHLHQFLLGEEHQLAFALMPILLIAVFLRMDINARSFGDRILTLLVLCIVGFTPFFRFIFD